MSTVTKTSSAEKRVRITSDLEAKILNVAGASKFNDALPTLDRALNLYKMVMEAQNSGSKFYEVDKNGEKYIVKFV
ncbi:hypothetical protein INT50_13100 [Vibrio diabolicus]|uniref:hypothetical protein n=1 Tax=Vibrio harveyi group TaxID=717610 RepID=UPI001123A542|nr:MULTISPECIES: hypothetical protein [Vibrio harveyi group]EHH2556235.1 hypothetical protein [Vibrio parahaemolyticus]EJG1824260.1 hypothetical protein [Vibrio parahaemolyticus]ELA9213393.1 hypothetical protein [Vibrio parahaemolyticus]ELB2229596.1 hypothetical protein [Vibrio parahaemolyticus]MCR9569888.1 hypothetical protein [Vibrio alginolyticus]